MNRQKQIEKSLQILLWLWFGTITSFVSVSVVNIARLETQIEIMQRDHKVFSDYFTKNK